MVELKKSRSSLKLTSGNPSHEILEEELLSHLNYLPFKDHDDLSLVSRFYDNKSVFVTGATGFIGKALIEKLLRSCPNIGTVYILIRDKHNKCAQERLVQMFENQIFDRINSRKDGRKLLESKIKVIRGDISQESFGISNEDLLELSDTVTIVFNSAATIKFEEPIENAVGSNISSVKHLTEFCARLGKLEALIHLSTAYSNCHKKDEIHEIFYEPPMSGDVIIETVEKLRNIQQSIYDCSYALGSKDNVDFNGSKHGKMSIATLAYQDKPCMRQDFNSTSSDASLFKAPGSSSLLLEFTRIAMLISERPNTYTFTKAIAESYLRDQLLRYPLTFGDLDESKQVAVAIIRPSIVGGAWRQPLAGFADNYSGPSGCIASTYVGFLQAMPGRGNARCDVVPVDMVVDCLIACGWYLVESKKKKKMPASKTKTEIDYSNLKEPFKDRGVYIFNFVSGKRNPLNWRVFSDISAEYAGRYPTKHVTRLPTSTFVSAGWRFNLYDLINHKLPAYTLDFVSKLVQVASNKFKNSSMNSNQLENKNNIDENKQFKKVPSAVDMYQRVKAMTDALTPFTMNQWQIDDSNTRALYQSLPSEIDKELFNFDVENIDWNDYVRSYVAGTRLFVLRDDKTSLASARRAIKLPSQAEFNMFKVMSNIPNYLKILVTSAHGKTNINPIRYMSLSSKEFNWKDPFRIEDQFNDDEKVIRDRINSYCQSTLQPRILEDYRKGEFDKKILRDLGGLGLLGATIKGYGCPGLSQISYGLIAREIERVDSGYRSAMTVQSSLSMFAISEFGSVEQKERYLPDMAKGKLVGCFAISEPDHGSDAGSLITYATHDSKNKTFTLNGTKIWITNSPISDIGVVWAKLKDDDNKIRGFIVDRSMLKDQSTFLTPKNDGCISLRAGSVGSVLMKNTVIPENSILPGAKGLKGPFSCLDESRYGLSWGAIGAAESCLHTTTEYLINRQQFGAPLASRQLIQKKLSDILINLTIGLNASLRVGRLKEAGLATSEMTSIVKKNNCHVALEAARSCRDMLGGNGISDEYHVIRHMVNLESVNTYEGTSDIHSLILGRSMTGIQAFV